MISILTTILLLFGIQAESVSENPELQDTTSISFEQDLSDSLFFRFNDLETERVTHQQLTDEDRILYLRDQWKFMPGDNNDWSGPDYDDTGWEVISTNLTSADLSFIEWEGIGWFRKELIVDSELRGKPIALIVDRHLGASEF